MSYGLKIRVLLPFPRLWIAVCPIIIVSQLPEKVRQEGVFRYLGLLAASPRHILGVETAYHACSPQKNARRRRYEVRRAASLKEVACLMNAANPY